MDDQKGSNIKRVESMPEACLRSIHARLSDLGDVFPIPIEPLMLAVE